MQSTDQIGVAPTDGVSSVDYNQANVIFKKMVVSDKEQNKRLSMRISGHKSVASRQKKVGGQVQGTRVRFLICTLGLLAILMSQMSRIILNVCITSMIDPSMLAPKSEVSSDGSCPVVEPVTRDVRSIDPISDFFTNSPSEQATDLVTEDIVEIVADTPDRFRWTIKQQNILLGGFYCSYFVVMIFGELRLHTNQQVGCILSTRVVD